MTAVISSLGVLAWRALSVSFSPFINEKLGARALKEIDIAVKPLMIFVGAFSILAAMLAPEIIKILATSDYYEGIYVVPPVAGGVFLHVMYNIFAAVSFFHKKSQMIMVATMTASISNIILNYVFIKYFGYIAAGYTTLIANIILTGMHYNNVRKIEKQAIYNGKFLLAVSCIVIGISLLCNFLYAEVMFAVRYMMALGVLVFLWMYRKKLIDALTNMKV